MNSLPLERRNTAGGENVNGEVEGQRAGVEEVERPKVDGSSGKVGAAGSLSNDGFTAGNKPGFSHAMFYHAVLPGGSRFVSGG